MNRVLETDPHLRSWRMGRLTKMAKGSYPAKLGQPPFDTGLSRLWFRQW